jgi:hypothetical protein
MRRKGDVVVIGVVGGREVWNFNDGGIHGFASKGML